MNEFRYGKRSRSMKAKSPHTRAGKHTGGARKGHVPKMIHPTTSRAGMHSGGAMGNGPHAPSTHGPKAKVHKVSGGKRTNKGKLPMRSHPRDRRGGRMGRRAPKMDHSLNREDFINRAEEALGDTEF